MFFLFSYRRIFPPFASKLERNWTISRRTTLTASEASSPTYRDRRRRRTSDRAAPRVVTRLSRLPGNFPSQKIWTAKCVAGRGDAAASRAIKKQSEAFRPGRKFLRSAARFSQRNNFVATCFILSLSRDRRTQHCRPCFAAKPNRFISGGVLV